MSGAPLVALSGLEVRIGGAPILSGIDLAVAAGEVVGVVGANGSGKTTLLRAALGLIGLSAGEARLGGVPVRALSARRRAERAAYLPQERRPAWNLPAWRLAALGAPFVSPAEAKSRAIAELDRLGLGELAGRGVLDMSGGERARVLLARLFVAGAPLILADEPTAGLDPDAALALIERLAAWARKGGAVLVTLHDLTLAARACGRLTVLKAGRVVADAPPREALAPAVLAAAFGVEGAVIETEGGPVVAMSRVAAAGQPSA